MSQIILEEDYLQPAEDDKIIFDYRTLGSYILSHAVTYYYSQIPEIRRHIGQRILSLISDRNVNDLRNASSELFVGLQGFAKDPGDDQRRRGHLDSLCNYGVGLLKSISSNPEKWNFGAWSRPDGRAIVYPSLLKGYYEVVESEAL
ncbi:hypothetical protein FGG08_003966 [Glutinoglossum americanum]|uniref:Uncharacterized protein n=1 Tax=Glutinoglossum americanum TaxID=1670608 RepID=A0A9P8L359_9PEZI|nr:hypothetical protein FGG08_003966 [Glutinoglossum americanum]